MILLLAALFPALVSTPAGLAGRTKLPAPKVRYQYNVASATSSPWIDANGWRMLRTPGARYYYDVPAEAAALAAAEAFDYGADAVVKTTAEGAARFGEMLSFLRGLPGVELPAMVNIGVVDDGSAAVGELMNLLTRRNLLWRPGAGPELTVRLGSKEFPKTDARDPSRLAQKIRYRLTDDRRLLRIYGSEVVIARLEGNAGRARVHLLNYGSRTVESLRVRVTGAYRSGKLHAFSGSDDRLADFEAGGGATEFTVPDLTTYAVIDLTR